MNASAASRLVLTAVAVLLSLSSGFAQGERLQRAILIEEQERNAKEAARLYEEIAKAEDTSPSDRTVAWFRLGKVLERLGRKDEARTAFEAAANGQGPTANAAKALLKNGGQDSDKERKLRAQARAIFENPTGNSVEKLRWVGVAAVPEIIRANEKAWRSGNDNYTSLLWEFGGERAKAFLTAALGDENVAFRTGLAGSLDKGLHVDLVEVALAFLEDTELPTSTRAHVLRQFALRGGHFDRLLKVVRSKDSQLVAWFWQIMSSHSNEARANNLFHSANFSDGREKRMRAVIPELRRVLLEDDPVVVDAAHRFLSSVGLKTRSGRAFMLEILPGWPRRVRPTDHNLYKDDRDDPASLRQVLHAARQLGPFQDDPRSRWFVSLVRELNPFWSREDLAAVLELVRLGYFQKMGDAHNLNQTRAWTDWLSRLEAEDAMAVVQGLADTPHLHQACVMISHHPLEETAWPILERCWRTGEIPLATALFRCMGNTGSPEAVVFFRDNLGKSPEMFWSCCQGLDAMSHRADSPEVRAAMRQAVRTGLEKFKDGTVVGRRKQRGESTVYHRLIELGDAEAFPLIPPGKSEIFKSSVFRESHGQSGIVKKHGFDAEAYANAWSFVLDRAPAAWSGQQVSCLLLPGGATARSIGPDRHLYSVYHARESVVRMLLTKVEKLVASAKIEERSDWLQVLAWVLDLPGRWESITPALEQSIQRLTDTCLASPSNVLVDIGLHVLHRRKPTPKQRATLLRLAAMKDGHAPGLAFRAIGKTVTLSEAEFTSLLANSGSDVRQEILGVYLPKWKGKVQLSVLIPSLSDESSRVRIMVCEYLGRRAEAEAVVPLLNLLRDPVAGVRKAAREALSAIRFYHEQKAHWDRMFQGPRVDGNSAAEALLKQASAGEKKDIRLVAIRSLGLLGKVETVSFLIDFSKEKDTEIADAARAAIQAILKRAAAGK